MSLTKQLRRIAKVPAMADATTEQLICAQAADRIDSLIEQLATVTEQRDLYESECKILHSDYQSLANRHEDVKVELTKIRSESEPVAWLKLTAAGQVKVGDRIRFISPDGVTEYTALEVPKCGTYEEEVVYDIKKNSYFTTSMVLKGESWHKAVSYCTPKPHLHPQAEGKVLVPIEPTDQMIRAGNDAFSSSDTSKHTVRGLYKAMITASKER